MTISKRAKLTKRDIKPKEIDYNLLADEVKDDIQNALDNTNVDLTNLSTDIIPSLSETFSLGTPDKKFHKAYIQELHIDENTLYIGDTPILGTEQDNILIQADQDQSILIKTKGLGSSGMSSQSNIHLETTGLNSEIRINSSGAGSKVSLGSNSSINLSAPEIKLDGDINVLGNLAVDSLSVRGNIAVEGEEFIVDTQTVQVENNIIEINKGEVGNGVTSGIAGIRIDRGDAPDYMLVFDEQNDMFMIGMDGDLETIATREYVDSKNLEVPMASIDNAGIVQLSSDVNSTSNDLAATPSAVKEAYDLAASKWTFDEDEIKGIKVNSSSSADTVNGFTVEANVPEDAKFTDTVYEHPENHPASMITGLATVAITGNYEDLINKPSFNGGGSGESYNFLIGVEEPSLELLEEGMLYFQVDGDFVEKISPKRVTISSSEPVAEYLEEGELYFYYQV